MKFEVKDLNDSNRGYRKWRVDQVDGRAIWNWEAGNKLPKHFYEKY